VRYYNLEHSLFPGDPIGLYDMDFGHMRGQNKPADVAGLSVRINEFFDHYVKGTGPQPPLGEGLHQAEPPELAAFAGMPTPLPAAERTYQPAPKLVRPSPDVWPERLSPTNV